MATKKLTNEFMEKILERYADKIPSSQLQDSRLWNELVEERAKELKVEIIS